MGGTALIARHFTDAERINAAIDDTGRHNFDMHAGYGWKRQVTIPKFRPELPKTFGGEFVKPLVHETEDFVWEPPVKPNAIVEPYRDMGRHEHLSDDAPITQKRHGDSKTRFEFNSKTDGWTRLNFAIPTPPPKPEPTARIKRYNNSLKGVTCFLPHSMTAGFEGDGEIKRQAKSIVAGI